MQVNGLQLPAALVQILQDANGETTEWMLKESDWRKQVNAYGDEFDLGDFMVLRYETMVRETADLPGRFDPSREKFYYSNREAKEPSTLPYIHDYSQIVVFGKKGSGEPYCLDYRGNPQDPSVFYLPYYGACWTRVAPNFDSFRELIIPLDDDEYDRRMAEEEAWDAEANRDLWDAEAAAERAALGPEEVTAIAYREAGHMVAAAVLGGPLMQASIKHPVNGLGRVSAQYADLSSWATAPPDQIKSEMVCGLAGLFARQLVDPSTDTSLALGPDEEGAIRFLTPALIGKLDEGAREERAQAFRDEAQALVQEHAAALQAVDAAMRQELGLGAKALVDQWIGRLEAGVREAAGTVSAAEAQAYRDEARVQARALVQEHRTAIQAVAEALLQELELDGEEVRALVDNARRGGFA